MSGADHVRPSHDDYHWSAQQLCSSIPRSRHLVLFKLREWERSLYHPHSGEHHCLDCSCRGAVVNAFPCRQFAIASGRSRSSFGHFGYPNSQYGSTGHSDLTSLRYLARINTHSFVNLVPFLNGHGPYILRLSSSTRSF